MILFTRIRSIIQPFFSFHFHCVGNLYYALYQCYYQKLREFKKNSYSQLFFAFLRLRTFIISCCLSPSTSANFRLISEYLSCISYKSISMELFRSFNKTISFNKTSIFCWSPESLSKGFAWLSDST